MEVFTGMFVHVLHKMVTWAVEIIRRNHHALPNVSHSQPINYVYKTG